MLRIEIILSIINFILHLQKKNRLSSSAVQWHHLIFINMSTPWYKYFSSNTKQPWRSTQKKKIFQISYVYLQLIIKENYCFCWKWIEWEDWKYEKIVNIHVRLDFEPAKTRFRLKKKYRINSIFMLQRQLEGLMAKICFTNEWEKNHYL